MVPPNFYCTRNTNKIGVKRPSKTAVVVLPGTVGAAADLVVPGWYCLLRILNQRLLPE